MAWAWCCMCWLGSLPHREIGSFKKLLRPVEAHELPHHEAVSEARFDRATRSASPSSYVGSSSIFRGKRTCLLKEPGHDQHICKVINFGELDGKRL